MRIRIATITLIAGMLLLAACGDASKKGPKADPAKSAAPTLVEQEADLQRKIELMGDLISLLASVEDEAGVAAAMPRIKALTAELGVIDKRFLDHELPVDLKVKYNARIAELGTKLVDQHVRFQKIAEATAAAGEKALEEEADALKDEEEKLDLDEEKQKALERLDDTFGK